MDIDGAFQEGVGVFRKHKSAEDLHEFTSFGGEDGSAEDAIVRSIDDNFHEAGGFAPLDGATHISHRSSAVFNFEPFGASFFLGHANAAELRIGENAGRDEPIFNREILPFHQIAVNNLKIVV